MSTTLYDDGELHVNQHSGGAARGLCFQITVNGQYVQLTAAQVVALGEEYGGKSIIQIAREAMEP